MLVLFAAIPSLTIRSDMYLGGKQQRSQQLLSKRKKMSNEIVVVDAEGCTIRSSRYGLIVRHPKTPPKPLPRPVKTPPPPATPTSLSKLEKLEDAVFNDATPLKKGEESYRVKYLKIYASFYNIATDYSDIGYFESHHDSNKHKALTHCWEELNWRPRSCRTRVFIRNPVDPYSK